MAELGPQREGHMRLGKEYGKPENRSLSMTFGDRGENETGCEVMGEDGGPEAALDVPELVEIGKALEAQDFDVELHCFDALIDDGPLGEALIALPEAPPPPEAAVLVVRGLWHKRKMDALEETMWGPDVPIDTMALFGRGKRRKVMNKHGRHNNCITDGATRPPSIASKNDYAEGKGSVIDLATLPELARIRDQLEQLVGRRLGVIENNYYYKVGKKNGIGWHGDAERRITVMLRLGAASIRHPIKFQWFWSYKAWGPIFEIPLAHGDLVIMSRVAVGTDWDAAPKARRWTMRHATGEKHAVPKNAEHSTHMRLGPPAKRARAA